MEFMTAAENVRSIPKVNKQPEEYSRRELEHLKSFIHLIKNNEKRTQLVCWGNHSDYTHGW